MDDIEWHDRGSIKGHKLGFNRDWVQSNGSWFGMIYCICGYYEKVDGWQVGDYTQERWAEHHTFRGQLKKLINEQRRNSTESN